VNMPSTRPDEMLALRKPAGHGLLVDERAPVPQVGPSDVLVQVTHAGICGTDKHIWDHDPWAAGRVAAGTVVGHELVGRVAEVGTAVGRLRPGQRVSAEGHIGCGECRACRTGDMHICAAVDIIGVDRDGCYAEYVVLPAENVWVLDEAVPDRHGALMDPLGNAVHTVATAEVSGRSVLVTGTGVIGLMAVAVARIHGADRIIATDLRDDRLALARELGADVVLRADDPDWVQEVRRVTDGGADALLEVSGSQAGLSGGLDALRNGGRAALLGLPSRPVTVDLAEQVIFKGLALLGVNGRRMFDTWYQTASILRSGRLDLDRFITGLFPIDRPEDAFRAFGSEGALKLLFEVAAVRERA
jgi:threonine 3-dehydrogenase